MNTLAKVTPILEKLFADDERTSHVLRSQFGALSAEERARRMADANADHRAFYAKMKDVHLAVSPETGKLLYMLARSSGAKAIVEYGTSFGISTIHLAAALRDNGGGTLIGSEFEPTKVAHANDNLRQAGLDDLVEIREGDALSTLAKDLPATIDGVLLDGAKPLYAKVLALVASRLRPGAWLVADNADACPDYLAIVRGDKGYISVPFAHDVELSIKL